MQRINTLKECRTEQGLSQLELYALSGVSPNTLVAIEKYYHLPRPKLRQALADALKVDVTVLFPDVTEGGNNE